MSKKRGLSLEEKRDKLLEIFHDTRDVFVLKEVEKLAVQKGVTLQSVKEVLQSLVDDDLVHQEKIGSSNYFWSFPSEAAVKLETEKCRLEARLETLQKERQSLNTELKESGEGREDTAERTQLLAEMQTLHQQLQEMQTQLSQYAENDPERFEAMRNAADIAKDSANRWLDNVYALKSWCKQRFQGMEDQLDSFFVQCGMTDDIDYLE